MNEREQKRKQRALCKDSLPEVIFRFDQKIRVGGRVFFFFQKPFFSLCISIAPRNAELPRPSIPVARLPRHNARDQSLPPRASKPVPRAAAKKKYDRTVATETPRPRSPLPTFLAALFAAGANLGPPLDGIHGAFALLRYDLAPLKLGDGAGALHTPLTVPLLLGTFYAASGFLHIVGDEFFSTAALPLPTLPLPLPRRGPALAACTLALVAAHLALSALLYNAGVPTDQISLALYPAAFLIWLSLDRTSAGAALALATAAAAPLAELLLMNAFGVWHYPRADLFLTLLGDRKGIVSWVPACYAGYSVWIGALTRWVRGAGGSGE